MNNCELHSGDEKLEKEKKSSLLKAAKKFSENLQKRGVIYMGRIPPLMKPNKVRSVFEQYGEVTRLFLAVEDATIRKKRKDNGGNGSKQFNEGWIEFADKTVAKQVAESLNNSVMGGKKGNLYHDDIWNLKYLKSFKWDYLTGKLAYERRVKENRMKVAMMQAKRTNAEFIEMVEKNKVQNIIQERKRKKANESQINSEVSNIPVIEDTDVTKKSKFRQNKSIGVHYGESEHQKVNTKLLKTIFKES